MIWDQAARTAAIRVKPTEEWEIELIGERAWEVAFIEGARWQRKHAGEEMNKYTAEDFKNARFAEQEGGGFAARLEGQNSYDDWPWLTNRDDTRSDAEVASAGWVPVQDKPTVTGSRLWDTAGNRGLIGIGIDDQLMNWAISDLGVNVTHEPTNAEKLADVYREWCGMDEVPNSLIRFMDEAGVTAPEET